MTLRPPGKSDVEIVDVGSAQELRAWLEANHETAKTCWLIRYRKSEQPDRYIPMDDIIDELLCFGWVDSVVAKRDAESSYCRISPRNPKSAWSQYNKDKIVHLRRQGRMTPAGEKLVAIAQSSGMWDFLKDVDDGIVPDDLAQALNAQAARKAFDDLPFSVRRGTLEWIKQAKRPDTRATRIKVTADSAAEGLPIPQMRKK